MGSSRSRRNKYCRSLLLRAIFFFDEFDHLDLRDEVFHGSPHCKVFTSPSVFEAFHFFIERINPASMSPQLVTNADDLFALLECLFGKVLPGPSFTIVSPVHEQVNILRAFVRKIHENPITMSRLHVFVSRALKTPEVIAFSSLLGIQPNRLVASDHELKKYDDTMMARVRQKALSTGKRSIVDNVPIPRKKFKPSYTKRNGPDSGDNSTMIANVVLPEPSQHHSQHCAESILMGKYNGSPCSVHYDLEAIGSEPYTIDVEGGGTQRMSLHSFRENIDSRDIELCLERHVNKTNASASNTCTTNSGTTDSRITDNGTTDAASINNANTGDAAASASIDDTSTGDVAVAAAINDTSTRDVAASASINNTNARVATAAAMNDTSTRDVAAVKKISRKRCMPYCYPKSLERAKLFKSDKVEELALFLKTNGKRRAEWIKGSLHPSLHGGEHSIFLVQNGPWRQRNKSSEFAVNALKTVPILARVSPATLGSCTAFVPCYSFEQGSKALRGSFIAVMVGDTWRLGVYISSAKPYRNERDEYELKLTYEEWYGPTYNSDQGFPTPMFIEMRGMSEKSHHFREKTVVLSKKKTLVFLNQVSGPRYKNQPLHPHVVNSVDGFVQGSPVKPDLLEEKLVECNQEEYEQVPVASLDKTTAHVVAQGVQIGNHTSLTGKDLNTLLVVFPITKIELEALEQNCHWVPYVPNNDKTTTFALIQKQLMEQFLKETKCGRRGCGPGCFYCGRLRVTEYHDLLKKYQIKKRTMDVIKLMDYDSVRLAMSKKAKSTEFIRGANQANHDLPGDAVSFSNWFKPSGDAMVSSQQSSLLRSTFGTGYGSRLVTSTLSQNAYFGRRRSSRSHPNLARGPSWSKEEWTYFTQRFDLRFFPCCQEVVNTLVNLVCQEGRLIDPIVWRALLFVLAVKSSTSFEHEWKKKGCPFCERAIVTQGQENKFISFSNSSHDDSFDRLSPEEEAVLDQLVKELLSSDNTDDNEAGRYLKKLKEVHDGFSRPTTCWYRFLKKHSIRNHKILSYFVYSQCGLAVQYCDDICHLFYGGVVVHNTALAVTVDPEGFVHLTHPEFNIFGWGKN